MLQSCNLHFGLYFHEVMSARINIDVRRSDCGGQEGRGSDLIDILV